MLLHQGSVLDMNQRLLKEQQPRGQKQPVQRLKRNVIWRLPVTYGLLSARQLTVALSNI
jgi:hypothetical protein